jgi:Arc/MetJ-type ribon-helix-helix transcriptional regulator
MSESKPTAERDRAETRSVELPAELAEDIERRVARTRYESVDAYVAVAMELLVSELQSANGDEGDATSGGSDEQTGESAEVDLDTDGAVADRLDSLGYL